MTAITAEASLRALLAASSSQVATARKILDSNDPHNRLNGDTDAIMLDTAGKQIGRIFANGVAMIEDDAIELFGGMDAIRNAMSQTDGVGNRATQLQAMLGNRGTVVDVAGYEKSRSLPPSVAADIDKIELSAAARDAMQMTGKTGEAPSAAAVMSAAVRTTENARLEAAMAQARAEAANRPPPPKRELTPEQTEERTAYFAKLQTISAERSKAHDEWITRFDAAAAKLKAAGARLGEASRKVPAFAIIRDAEGKEAGRILQGGGASLDGRLQAMLAMLWADKKGFDGNAHDLFDAIQKKLGEGFTIEKTGVEVNMEEVLAAEYADLHAAQDEFQTLAAEGRAISENYREAMSAARPDWMNRMSA
jgi:hypothetical protein